MTGRKPAGVSWQSWIDRQIEQGRDRGDFDDLPGHGKPLDGVDRPRDELWWVRDKLKREGVEYLPPSLAIRKKAADAEQRALIAGSEHEARTILQEINDEIVHLNRHSVEGPPTTLMTFDVDEVLEARRKLVVEPPSEPALDEPGPEPQRARGTGGLLVRLWRRVQPT